MGNKKKLNRLLNGVILAAILVMLACVVGIVLARRPVALEQQRHTKLLATAGIEKAATQTQMPEVTHQDIDWTGLLQMNSDCVGWLWVPGTVVQYPVVQGQDNSYYLNHSFEKEYSPLGGIFMDSEVPSDLTGDITFMYGHNAGQDEAMFTPLQQYTESEFWQSHPVFYYFTPRQSYKIEVFAAFTGQADPQNYRRNFLDEEDFAQQIAYLKQQAAYTCDVEVAPEDRVVALSTCSSANPADKNERVLVFGVLRPM